MITKKWAYRGMFLSGRKVTVTCSCGEDVTHSYDAHFAKHPECWESYQEQLANEPHRIYRCRHCREEFLQEDGYGPTKTQCPACAKEAANARQREKRSENRPAKLTCEHCGEKFKPKRTTARFCSDKCRVYWHRNKSGPGG